MNAHIPPSVRWKADNYNHLMEQPTQFYAVVLALALLSPASSSSSFVLGGDADGLGLEKNLAWLYVGLRVVHSLVQAMANRVMLRFSLFVTSSLVLLLLTLRLTLRLL